MLARSPCVGGLGPDISEMLRPNVGSGSLVSLLPPFPGPEVCGDFEA